MKRLLACFCTVVLVLGTVVSVHALNLITNPGFETGDFTGWNVSNQTGGSGSFFVTNANTAPLTQRRTVGPANGLFYAVSDQWGPGAYALWQTFTVASPAASVILSFDMFVNDYDQGPIVNPAGLSYTTGPNQHGRVDILSAGSNPFDTGAGVLANFYLDVDPGSAPNPYTSYLFDITALVGGGGDFMLRFAQVQTQALLHMGVDNASVDFTAVPEPATLLLLGSGLLGFLGFRKKFRL